MGCVNTETGNSGAVVAAYGKLGLDCKLVQNPEDLKKITHLVIPGVGSYGELLKTLEISGLRQAIQDFHQSGAPILGICLGYQVMGILSTENENFRGLGFIDGKVERLSKNLGDHSFTSRSPHIGFNSVIHDENSRIMSGISSGTEFYFSHSYGFLEPPSNMEHHAFTVGPDAKFTSMSTKGNLTGLQFHPEKSLGQGLKLLENFLYYAS